VAWVLQMPRSMRSDANPGPGGPDQHAEHRTGEGIRSEESLERKTPMRRRTEFAAEASVSGEPDLPDIIAPRAFTALADNVRDYAIFLMDPEGVITFWGEGARLIKWWSRQEAEGSHLRLLYPDGGSEDGTATDHLAAAAEHGEYTGEGHRVRSDGSTFWAGVTLTALRDHDGSLHGFAKVTRDLTAQRAGEAAGRAALDAAEEANRLKGLFLATMSHEIRTPLNAIMAYTDLLQMEMEGPLTPRQQEQLAKIRVSSQHLLGIVEDVLDLSRIEAGRFVVGRSRLRLGTLLAQTLMLVEPQAARAGVEIVDAVSGAASDLGCWGDEERIRQIVINLLSNAVKFTGRGGRITISAGSAADPPRDAALADPGPWTYIRVEDTGIGIPPERLGAIFDPFVQADMSLTRQHGGSGLGLSISRRLARLMGGDLTARSEPGVGSTFFLWLPAAPEQGATPAARAWEAGTAPATLRAVRDAVLGEMERILRAYVARLRGDPAIPRARSLSEAQLEDHLASFLADLAQTLGGMDLTSGAESEALRDGTAIQRTIADRHGRQRARLGWTAGEVEREFTILGEELAAAVRRTVHLPRPEEVEEAIDLLAEFLATAERISVRSLLEEERTG
jgi:PAS domain S-box-containing protein